ncbi:MAG: CoA ester lyase [Burkholderiaceae bacterium]|jgi:citrate lyase subunit beta/citryl-CoA lyase|nr:CoA ester lyase [Burkholderiaceae bacterium]
MVNAVCSTPAQARHPREVLLGAQAASAVLPVCDHYCGVQTRMRKSIALQREMTQEFNACVFDVTLDCEDGAPVGGEAEHAQMVVELAAQARQADPRARIGVRVHPVDHPAFEADMATIAGRAGAFLSHIMIPKVESAGDVARAERALLAAYPAGLPLHALIESPRAVHNAFDIAAHPRVQSLSFGLMDFVSAHGGAIPAEAMGVPGQFTYPLVVRAKLEIASAAHANGKTPAHGVVTEFSDPDAVRAAARRAAREFACTRMWSIHPAQIRPIIEAFAPDRQAVEAAAQMLLAAAQADWAPISVRGVLQDRASYRYYWQTLLRAHATGRALPDGVVAWF